MSPGPPSGAARRRAVPASRRPRSAVAPGFALVDVVCACALLAVLAGIALPMLHALGARDAARMAAVSIKTRLQQARLESLARNRIVAVRIDPDPPHLMRRYVDGDGDGVLQTDIDAAIDRPLDEERDVREEFPEATFAIATAVPAPDGGGELAPGSDPIRLGSSHFVSFHPVGSSSSGTLYVAARDGSQAAIRLYGVTGRMRALWFDRATGAWRED